MKKNLFYFAALAAIATTAISCSQKLADPSEPAFEPKVLTAYTDDDAMSKTSYDGTSIIWTADDQISVFDADKANHASTKTTVSDDGKTGTFAVGDMSADDEVFLALYPYDDDAYIDRHDLYTTIPTVQNIVAGSFANGANVAIAIGGSDNLQFRNVGAFLSLTVADENIVSVKLSADQLMTGDVDIEYESEDFDLCEDISDGKSMQKYVELRGDFVPGQRYYFVVTPGVYSGLTITLTDANGREVTLSNPNKLTVSRNENVFIGNIAIPTPTIKDFAKQYVKLLDVWENTTGTITETATRANVHYIPMDETISVAGISYTIPQVLEIAARSYLLLIGYDGTNTSKTGANTFPALTTPATLATAMPAIKTYGYNYWWYMETTSGNGGPIRYNKVANVVTLGLLDNYSQRNVNYPAKNSNKWANLGGYNASQYANFTGCLVPARAQMAFLHFFKYMLDNNLDSISYTDNKNMEIDCTLWGVASYD